MSDRSQIIDTATKVLHAESEPAYREIAAQVIAAVGPMIEAEALRAAADDWAHGEWANTPTRSDSAAQWIAVGQYVTDWLRARAAAKQGRS